MKAIALLSAAALVLAACSGEEPAGPTRQQVSEITVNTDLSAIGNANAVTYWTNLSTDLKTALAQQFVNDISTSGAQITVDVDSLSLANSYTAKFGEGSVLSGRVSVVDHRGQSLGVYNVSASSNQAMSELPAGTTSVSPTSTEFYRALVKAFARGVDVAVNGATAP